MPEFILKNLNDALQYIIFISLIIWKISSKDKDEVHFVRQDGEQAKPTETSILRKISIAENAKTISEIKTRFEAFERETRADHEDLADTLSQTNQLLHKLIELLIRLQTQLEERSKKDV